MIVQDLKTNTEAPFLGKEGPALLELWKAGMEWSAKVVATTNPSVQPPIPPDPGQPQDPFEAIRHGTCPPPLNLVTTEDVGQETVPLTVVERPAERYYGRHGKVVVIKRK